MGQTARVTTFSPTRTRPVRVSDEVWHLALSKARREGTNLHEVIRSSLTAYVRD